MSRGTRNRTSTHHPETVGHQHPHTTTAATFIATPFVNQFGPLCMLWKRIVRKVTAAYDLRFSNAVRSVSGGLGNEHIEEVLLLG
jgi:hypothetical protein